MQISFIDDSSPDQLISGTWATCIAVIIFIFDKTNWR